MTYFIIIYRYRVAKEKHMDMLHLTGQKNKGCQNKTKEKNICPEEKAPLYTRIQTTNYRIISFGKNKTTISNRL